jgi:hypothetical protein
MRNTRTWLLVSLLVVAGLLAVSLVPPSGGANARSFDPDRVANLELRMWQAYYAKERLRLFGLLVVTLREQYRFSWAGATVTAFRLAKAAAAFGDATGNYERVLPDLVTAYEAIQDRTGESFSPPAVANAELAWWVARRVPGQDSPENVGRLIAEEYAAFYREPLNEMLEAGALRARAAALRDSQASRPDWSTIERMLTSSYRSLKSNIANLHADGG